MNSTNSAARIDPRALVEDGAAIGARTRIWGFTHILAGAVIGEDCNICEQVFVENDVRVGNRVTVKNGVQLWDGIRLGNDVFVGPNVTFTNDPWPRSRNYPEAFPETHVKKGASLGGGFSSSSVNNNRRVRHGRGGSDCHPRCTVQGGGSGQPGKGHWFGGVGT